MRVNSEILDIWVKSFEGNSIWNVPAFCVTQELAQCAENFFILRIKLNSRDKYYTLPPDQKANYLVNIFQLKEQCDFQPYINFLVLAAKQKQDKKFVKMMEAAKPHLCRFLIKYTTSLLYFIETPTGNEENLKQMLSNLSKIISCILKVSQSKDDPLIILAHCFFGNLNIDIKALFQTAASIGAESVFVSLANESSLYLQAHEAMIKSFSNFLNYSFKCAFVCLKNGNVDPVNEMLCSSVISLFSSLSLLKCLHKNDLQQLIEFSRTLLSVFSPGEYPESVGILIAVLKLGLLISSIAYYEDWESIPKAILDYLSKAFTLTCGEFVPEDARKIESNKEEIADYSKSLVSIEELDADSSAHKYKFEMFEDMKLVSTIYNNTQIIFKENIDIFMLMIGKLQTYNYHIGIITGILNIFNEYNTLFVDRIDQSVIQMFTKECFFNDSTFKKQDTAIFENYYNALETFISSIFVVERKTSLFIDFYISMLKSNQPLIIGFLLRILTEILKTNFKLYSKFHNQNFIDTLLQFDNSMKNCLSKEDNEDYKRVRAIYFKFMEVFSCIKDNNVIIFSNQQRTKALLKYLNEKELQERMLAVIKKVLSSMQATYILFSSIVSFIKEKSENMTMENAELIIKLIDIINDVAGSKTNDIEKSARTTKGDKIFNELPLIYSKTEGHSNDVLMQIVEKLLIFISKMNYLSEEYNNSPFQGYEKILQGVADLQISEQMIQLLIDLSLDKEKKNISACGPLHFLLRWTYKSQYIEKVAEKLIEFTKQSIANRYMCFKADTLTTLIEALSQQEGDNTKVFECISLIGQTFFHKKELTTAFRCLKVAKKPTKIIDMLTIIASFQDKNAPKSLFYVYPRSDSFFAASDIKVNGSFMVATSLIYDNTFNDKRTILGVVIDNLHIKLEKEGMKFQITVILGDKIIETSEMLFESFTEILTILIITVTPAQISFKASIQTNEKEITVQKKGKKFPVVGSVSLVSKNCYLNNVKVINIASKQTIIQYNAKNVNWYCSSDQQNPITFKGLLIKFIPKLVSSIPACGGPKILLPVLEEALNAESPELYIVKVIKFFHIIIFSMEKEFKYTNFFVSLNQILKKLYKARPSLTESTSIPEALLTIYNFLTVSKLKKEMMKSIWLDLSLTKYYPTVVNKLLDSENEDFIDGLGTLKSLYRRLNAHLTVSDKADKSIENTINQLFVCVAEKRLDISKNLNLVFVSAMNIQNIIASRISLKFIIQLLDKEPNQVLNYTKQYGYYQPILQALLSSDYEIQGYIINIIAKIHSLLPNKDEPVTELYEIAAQMPVNHTDNWDIVLAYTYHVLTHKDFVQFKDFDPNSISEEKIVNQDFLPIICSILTNKEATETSSKVLSCLLSSIEKYGIPKVNDLYTFMIIYIAYITNEQEKWIHVLYQHTSNTLHFEGWFSAAFIYSQLVCLNPVDEIAELSDAIIDSNSLNRENLASYILCITKMPNIPQTDVQEIVNFMTFVKAVVSLVNAFKDSGEVIKITSTNVTPKYTATIKKALEFLASDFNIFSSELVWFMFVEIFFFMNQFDDEFCKEVIQKLVVFTKTINENNIPLMLNFAKYLCQVTKGMSFEEYAKEIAQNLNLSSDSIEQMNISSNEIFDSCDKQFIVNFNNSLKPILKIYNSFTNLSPEYTEFLISSQEFTNDMNNIERFRHLEKKNAMIWQNIKNEIENSINGIWSSDNLILHTKFDNTYDFSGRHYRTGINRHFDDHKAASLLRDETTTTADVNKNVELKNMFFKETNHGVPSDLIDVIDCNMLKMKSIYIGKIYITETSLFFDSNKRSGTVDNSTSSCNKYIEIELQTVNSVLWRRSQLLDIAVEVFTKNRVSYFFIFSDTETRNKFISTISDKIPKTATVQKKPIVDMSTYNNFTKAWKEGKMSTYRYLFWVNMFAGRSFNDISQYPVFPWVLSEYGDKIDLNDPYCFRNFSEPMGGQTPGRLEALMETRSECTETYELNCLYRSHYSTPSYVILYLMRIEPFTTLHIKLQNNRFDNPNRLFYSVGKTWNAASSVQGDFRELIPEFFSFSNFLVNKEKYDLGVLVNGTRVDDVELPKWAHNAAQFIMINRYALESPYVSSQISKWIDLVFGFKQSGEEAEKAHNTFSPYSYAKCLNNPEVDIEVARASASNFGTCPEQIFKKPHPERKIALKLSSFSSKMIIEQTNYGFNIFNTLSIFTNGINFFMINKESVLSIIKEGDVLENVKLPFSADSSKHILFFHNEDVIVVGSPFKDTFDVYSIEKKTLIKTSEPHLGTVTCLGGFEPAAIVSCGEDASAYIWSDLCFKRKIIITTHSEEVVLAQSSISLDAVVTIDKTGNMITSSAITGKPYASIQLSKVPTQLLLSPVGYIVLIFSEEKSTTCTIEVRELTGTLVSTLDIEGHASCASIACFGDYVEFLLLCIDRKLIVLRLCDLKTAAENSLNSIAYAICFNKNNMTAFASLFNGDVARFSFSFK